MGAGVEGPLATTFIHVIAGHAEGLARLVGHDRAAVAGVDVKLAVRAGDHGMERVVMVLATEAGEEGLLLIDGSVELAVAIHVGVLRDGRGVRDVDDVVDDGDAERRGPIGVLDERLDGIGEALSLRVAEHDHAIAFGATLAALVIGTIVHALVDPEAALGVEIDVGRVSQHGRTSPERDLETFGQLKERGRKGTAFGRLVRLGRRLGGRGGLGGGHEGRGGQEEKRGTGEHGGEGFYIPEGRKFQPIFSEAPFPASAQAHHWRRVAKSLRVATMASFRAPGSVTFPLRYSTCRQTGPA